MDILDFLTALATVEIAINPTPSQLELQTVYTLELKGARDRFIKGPLAVWLRREGYTLGTSSIPFYKPFFHMALFPRQKFANWMCPSKTPADSLLVSITTEFPYSKFPTEGSRIDFLVKGWSIMLETIENRFAEVSEERRPRARGATSVLLGLVYTEGGYFMTMAWVKPTDVYARDEPGMPKAAKDVIDFDAPQVQPVAPAQKRGRPPTRNSEAAKKKQRKE
jgi:hypothetical protein